MFSSQRFANTRSTKALGDYFALPERPPTSATLPFSTSDTLLPSQITRFWSDVDQVWLDHTFNFCVKKGRNCGGFLQKCFTPVAWGAMLCHVMPFSPFFRLVGKCFIFWSSPTLWGYFEGCGWFGESGTVQENWDFDPSSLNSAQGWQHCQMMSWKDPSVPKTFHTNMRYSTSIAHL